MVKRLSLLAAIAGVAALLAVPSGSAGSMPSGQVMYGSASFDFTSMTFVGGGGTIEPAYDDANGSLVYLQTPNGSSVHPNGHDVAPLYLTMYPAGSMDPSSLNCAHLPADNCPDHGNLVAGAAEAIVPSVYGGGVAGHDHLIGVASTGGDFNVVWEPVLVLFTSWGAVHRITTLSDLQNALDTGQVIEVPLPQADFHCSMVSAAAYNRGTPSPTVVGP